MIKYFKYCIILLFIFKINLKAQSTFEYFSSSSQSDVFFDVYESESEHLYLTGYERSTLDSTKTNPKIIKLDKNGNLVQSMVFNEHALFGEIIPINNADFIIIGNTLDSLGNLNVKIWKIDTNLNLIWTKEPFHFKKYLGYTRAKLTRNKQSIALTALGANSSQRGYREFHFLKINFNGDSIFHHKVVDSLSFIIDFLEYKNENKFLFFSLNILGPSFLDHYGPEQTIDIAKTDGIGNLDTVFYARLGPASLSIQSNQPTYTGAYQVSNALWLNDEKFAFLGNARWNLYHSNGKYEFQKDLVLTIMDTNYNYIKKTYLGNSQFDEATGLSYQNLHYDALNDVFYVVGNRLTVDTFPQKTVYYLAKLSGDAKQIYWEQTYDRGHFSYFPTKTITTKDGGILILGYQLNSLRLFQHQGHILKLNAWGGTTSGINSNTLNGKFGIYPNPFHNEFMVEIPENETYNFVLYDVTGKFVLKQKIENKSKICVNQLQKGIYIYKIFNSKEQNSFGKLVKN